MTMSKEGHIPRGGGLELEHIFMGDIIQPTTEVTGTLESCFCGKIREDDGNVLRRDREVGN